MIFPFAKFNRTTASVIAAAVLLLPSSAYSSRPGLDFFYKFHNIETIHNNGSLIRLASIYEAAIVPSIGWSTSTGSDPLEFRIHTSVGVIRYRSPNTPIDGRDRLNLFGAGAELSKEWGRISLSLASGYAQKQVLDISAETSRPFFQVVAAPYASLDLGLITIGTTEKALRFGAKGKYDFRSSVANGIWAYAGPGLELYSSFEFLSGKTLYLSFVRKNSRSSVGSLDTREVVAGLKIIGVEDDFGRMPLDY